MRQPAVIPRVDTARVAAPLNARITLTPKDAPMFKRLLVALLAFFALSVFAADANNASQADLEAIKGIGPAISTRIIDERKNGAYKDWPDLIARVKGIGDKSAAKLSTAGLTVNGAPLSGAPAATPAPAKTAAAAKATTAAPAPAPAPAATPAVAAKPTAAPAPATPASTAKELKKAAAAQAKADKASAAAQKKADKAAAKASAASAASAAKK